MIAKLFDHFYKFNHFSDGALSIISLSTNLDTMNVAGRAALEGQLVATIQENLSLYLNENAIFLAERLVAEFPSEQNVYLLATCYHRAQQTYRAYHLLKRKEQSGNELII